MQHSERMLRTVCGLAALAQATPATLWVPTVAKYDHPSLQSQWELTGPGVKDLTLVHRLAPSTRRIRNQSRAAKGKALPHMQLG